MMHMTELSRMRVGQTGAVRAGLSDQDGAERAETDKWRLLDALTQASKAHGLNHRTLGVLRALLSFFPERALPCDPGLAVVYPSNRTLSRRLNGMPESTLRRHLATLVRRGIIARQDSANRKRFARFGVAAFGFDLSPLARAAPAVFDAAERAREEDERISALRALLAATRQRILDTGALSGDDPLVEEARLCQRRVMEADALETLVNALENRLATARRIARDATKTSATHNDNERHIQGTNKKDSVENPQTGQTDGSISADTVSEVCKEYRTFFPDLAPGWPGLVQASDRLHAMMGIEPQVYDDARRHIGVHATTAAVLCMLDRMPEIKSPGAYLRGLTQRARQGRFDLPAMLRGTATRAIVS
jgi:replication initiation protein RepC